MTEGALLGHPLRDRPPEGGKGHAGRPLGLAAAAGSPRNKGGGMTASARGSSPSRKAARSPSVLTSGLPCTPVCGLSRPIRSDLPNEAQL